MEHSEYAVIVDCSDFEDKRLPADLLEHVKRRNINAKILVEAVYSGLAEDYKNNEVIFNKVGAVVTSYSNSVNDDISISIRPLSTVKGEHCKWLLDNDKVIKSIPVISQESDGTARLVKFLLCYS